MDKEHFPDLIAFCVLMENNDGILGKSPEYVMEKFIRYVEYSKGKEHKWGLDVDNRQKLKTYFDRWFSSAMQQN